MDARTFSLALALGLVIAAAHATDPVYKSTMSDGRVIYGESPQPGAKRVDKVAAPPEVTGVVTLTPEDKMRASTIRAPSGPAVTVIPQKERPATAPAMQGATGNPGDRLPSRSY